MMAYDNKLVLAILHKGAPLREVGGKVHLPFDSSYKVRIKNKHSFLRTKARVWIDGRLVSNLGDFILAPNETIDLERFLTSSMDRGNKFKFVPLSDSRVNDPTDFENGTIKVEFYREREILRNLFKPKAPKVVDREIIPPGSTWSNNFIDTITSAGRGTTSCTPTYAFNSCVSSIPVSNSAGATVEGEFSNQSFIYGDDFPTETYPITLELCIRGLDNEQRVSNDRSQQSKKRIKFCPNCGTKRHGMVKFCANCGVAYHPRYERGRIVS